jgi:flagellar capping protein FliD
MGEDFGNSAAVDSFVGTATSGGFLEAATNAMTGLEDPTTGIVKTDETDIQNQISSLNDQITTRQAQVTTLQQNLTTQMDAADAAIATMEQQYTYLSGMFQAQQVADAQYSGL